MSLHSINPETLAIVGRQRKASFLGSMVIALLSTILAMLALSFILLAPIFKEVPTIVTYSSSLPEQTDPEMKKISNRVNRKPTAPSSSVAPVIAASTNSPTSIPVPDVEATSPSIDFGDSDDFGEGWGSADGSSAGGGASFFNQSVKAERIAYVIDYSRSMKGKREELMRDELKKSVSGLSAGSKYQMIYFAGPAWVAGDELKFPGNDLIGKTSKTAEVKTAGGKKYQLEKKGGWQVPGNYKASWLNATSDNLKDSRKSIRDTELILGTEWLKPLNMALEMDPPPQIIFFMTDGTGGSLKGVEAFASKAKRKGVVINSVAMMTPKAAEAMAALAHGTGGIFTVIEENGKAKEVKPTKK